MGTAIEWCDEVWNPTVGCSRVSPGCDRCYAIGVAHRAMQPAHEGLTIRRPGEPTDWTGEVRCIPERLETPLRWRKPRRVFVDSMSDLFHPEVPDEFIYDVVRVMLRARRHTFQVLTKRPQRMARWFAEWGPFSEGGPDGPDLANIWLGTSIESNRYAWRADHLRAVPGAVVRFVSAEPLLGPLDQLDLEGVDWLIVGGESGPGARPMHPEWARQLRDRCRAAGVAFHFKQWGEWLPGSVVSVDSGGFGDILYPANGRCDDNPLGDVAWPADCTPDDRWHEHGDGVVSIRVGKRAAGRHLDGRTWDEFPA